jgi:glycosyltransferase involved in cell wall biosynthesis
MSDGQVIFATHRPPWPLDNGARIRTARLAQALAEHFELTLVTFADGPVYDDTRATRDDLESLLPGASIELVAYGRPHPRGARRQVLKPGSAAWGAYATETMRSVLAARVDAQPAALLHLDMPGTALAGVGLAPGRTIFSTHNVEHRIWREVVPRRPWTQRPFLAVEWRKVAAEERRCWRQADLTLAVSEFDASLMRSTGAREVEVFPNGADPRAPLPPAPRREDEPVRLLFVGSGAYWPYEHGIAWMAREVMPRLRERLPVEFDVVGELPPDPVRGTGITYHGRVEDLEPYYARAHALVVPAFEGSGTRLKVIEASMYGRPVISTTLGAEGLPLRAGEQYEAAETTEEWVKAVERLATGGLEGLAGRARDALKDYTWPRIGAALAARYERLQMTSTR